MLLKYQNNILINPNIIIKLIFNFKIIFIILFFYYFLFYEKTIK